MLALFVLAAPTLAHPVPRAEYDRNVSVEWRPDGLYVLYRVEIDEFTLLKTVGDPANGFPLDFKKISGRDDVARAYVARMKVVLADGLIGTIDGKRLEFQTLDAKHNFADSAQFRFWFKAPYSLDGGRHGLELEDLNYLDKKGRFILKLEVMPGMEVERIAQPPEGRTINVPEAERRTVSATIRVPGTLPPPEQSTRMAEPEEAEPTGFWDLFRRVQREENLAILLDSQVGLWVVLAMAFLHGVIHSVSPGHGKTMVAAYLIGEQGTPKHAVILGLIVTLTHTSAAFAVALLLKFVLTDTAPEQVQSVLGMGGGAIVAFIGLWLLMQRLAGRSDHVHAFGAHSHSHSGGEGHGHSHGLTPEQFGRVSWLRLILLGISGGVIPCWGAILWVLYCVTAGRFGLALWAVLAFSVGLASVLILIGLSVVWASGWRTGRFGGSKRFRYISRGLPILGAMLVVVIGLWLVRVNMPR